MAGSDIAPVEPQVDISIDNEESTYNDAFYAGVGYTRVRYDEKAIDHSDRGFTLQVGYDFNPYMGVEARYTNTSKDSTGYSFDGDLENIALYLKPMLPVTQDVALYALLGYGKTSIDTQIGEESESGFQLGIGSKYNLIQNLSLFVDYTQFYKGNGFNRDPLSDDVTLYSINVGLNYIY
jgi:opacity protein-like surface antigen